VNSLARITDKEYAAKTVEDISRQSGYNLWEWTGKGFRATLISTYYSASETGTLKIQMGCLGKTVSLFFTGNSNDVAKATHLWVSFWDMTSHRS
jgi:hypothetical protein